MSARNIRYGWLVCLAFPLLMGAKGGCSEDDVSMGTDHTGGAAEDNSGGKTAVTSGGKAGTGGISAIGSGGQDPSTTGGSTQTASGGSSADACDGYDDARPGREGSVVVRYFNDGDAPIYIGAQTQQCQYVEEFELHDEAGKKLSWRGQFCLPTCQTWQDGGIVCPAVCLFADLVRIDPGGHRDFIWDGILSEEMTMPNECYPSTVKAQGTCTQRVKAGDGQFSVVGKVWPSFQCQNGPCSDCEASDDGSCVYHTDAVVTGEARQISGLLAYPSDSLVELHFD